MDEYSWTLCSDNVIRHNKQEVYRLNNTSSSNNGTQLANMNSESVNVPVSQSQPQQQQQPCDGDIIGVSYDHIQLKFYLNGQEIESTVTNVRGTVYPALYGKLLLNK